MAYASHETSRAREGCLHEGSAARMQEKTAGVTKDCRVLGEDA